MRDVPACAVAFIKGAETCRLTPYLDGAGVPTDGWGNTTNVNMGQRITPPQAEADLARNLGVAAGRLAAKVKPAPIAALSDHQYGALISFVFNVGAGDWEIWRLLNAGQLGAVPDQLMRFTKERNPHTHVLEEVKGLHNRRAAEVAFWKTADVTAAHAVIAAGEPAPPSSYTRDGDTPPTPAAVKPLARSRSFVATALGSCATCATAALDYVQPAAAQVKSAADAIAPMADGSDHVAHLHSLILTVAAGLTLSGVVLLALKHHQARTS